MLIKPSNRLFYHLISTKRITSLNMTCMPPEHLDHLEDCKKNAAYQAVKENIYRDGVVGVGSGSTIRYVIEGLAELCSAKPLKLKFIPTSNKTRELIQKYGLNLTDLDSHPVIDVTIDGADEVDKDFICIKGGGGCVTQEKIVACASKKFIIVADWTKNSYHLTDRWKRGIPIDVIPISANVVRRKISKLFNTPLDDIPIRMKPDGLKPVITDDGNYILDWRYEMLEEEKLDSPRWRDIADQIKLITGVVDIGIFADLVHSAYFGLRDGTVSTQYNRKLPIRDDLD